MKAYHLKIRRKGIGDTLAATAFIRDYLIQHPNSRLSVEGTEADGILQYAPTLTEKIPGAEEVTIDYKSALDRSRFDHNARYLLAAYEEFQDHTGVRVVPTRLRPHIDLSPEELITEYDYPYVVIASGVKLDIPLKRYPPDLWNRVVELGRDRGWRFKQVGLVHDGKRPHIQAAIPGVDNFLGRTDLRGLFRLIRHAAGVICHVSLPMLVASAFQVPCVAIGGGREDPWFFEGSGVTYLHTVGRLDCCRDHGCRTVFPIAVHQAAPYPIGTLCSDPVVSGGTYVGKCMTIISPEEIVAALERSMSGFQLLN